MVLLKHDLPDGSSHFDWLLQPGGSTSPLVAFRVLDRIDAPHIRAFRAIRLPDHRPLYLSYEGPIAGDRGVVVRVAAGVVGVEAQEPGRLVIRGGFAGDAIERVWEGHVVSGHEWTFAVTEEFQPRIQ